MVNTILEFDNFVDIDVLEGHFNELMEGEWSYFGSAYGKDTDKKLWYRSILEEPFYLSIFEKIKKVTGKNYVVDRVYANGQLHGQCGNIHKDYDSEISNAKTLLIYMNYEWKPEWGGHTVIEKSEGEYVSILPKPGKAILFDGTLNHVGLEPTIHCNTMRVTVVYKMREV